MTNETRTVAIQRIYLDNNNARHEPIDNESAITAHLIVKEQVKPLARHIAQNGLSPLDRLAVIRHEVDKNSFVVVEGNRRICAIKLLNNPEKAPNEGHRKFFREQAKLLKEPLNAIEVVIFPSREAARPWLALRHEGALNGVGMRGWDAIQKARHNMSSGVTTTPNAQAVLLLDYAIARKLISDNDRKRISVTTLTRFLSNPVFRNTLGLTSAGKLDVEVPQPEFDRAVDRFLNDALDGKHSGVNSRTSKRQRQDYAHKLRGEGIAPSARLATPYPLNSKTGEGGNYSDASDTNVAKRVRNNKNPDHRRRVIPSDTVIKIKNKILKRIYDELRGVDSVTHSFAAAYLLRAMIEQVMTVFCRENGIPHNVKLHTLIERVEKFLVNDGVPERQLKLLRVMANQKDSPYSPETLGASVHGSLIPTGPQLARHWDSLEAPLIIVINRLKK